MITTPTCKNSTPKANSCFGGAGDGAGQFEHATGIALDAEGNLYVADYEGNRVQKFTHDGEYLTEWRANRPDGMTVDAAGRIYVTEYDTGRVKIFSIISIFWGRKFPKFESRAFSCSTQTSEISPGFLKGYDFYK
jgi:DNA-binding beta-propeller fold protein YncE